MINSFKQTPDVVKNLVIINVLVWIAAMAIPADVLGGKTINNWLAIYYWDTPNFSPYQIVTHMFCHATSGSFMLFHILFNMYALWMFGSILERTWGEKRFLFYYLACGIGAGLLTMAIDTAIVQYNLGTITPEMNQVVSSQTVLGVYYKSMVGASGAVYGLLLAFGMAFPRMTLRLLFPPIALEARYLVMILIAFELYMSFSQSASGIGHVAHLSGMLVGFIILKIWHKF